MQTIDGQVLTVTVGRYLVDPTVPTINLPDRFIPIMNASNLADLLERLLQTNSTGCEMFANLRIQQDNNCITLSVQTLDAEENTPNYTLDEHNACRLIAELRNVAGMSDTMSLIAFVDEVHG